jgi:hypothetical protein
MGQNRLGSIGCEQQTFARRDAGADRVSMARIDACRVIGDWKQDRRLTGTCESHHARHLCGGIGRRHVFQRGFKDGIRGQGNPR